MSTSTTTGDRIVTAYLADLRAAAAHLPPATADELVADITEHIAAARADLPDETESDVRAILYRLGSPAEIASAAGPSAHPSPGGVEYGTIVALTVGTATFAGPILGLVLMHVSRFWTPRERRAAWALFFAVPLAGLVCAFGFAYLGGAPWQGIALGLAMVVAGPITAGIFLATGLRRAR
ncbi:MAG: hypothetical protein JWO79_3847 [Actinomycetia bacterium]|nr:hypothetical protein [Actinomycetes bacterium]